MIKQKPWQLHCTPTHPVSCSNSCLSSSAVASPAHTTCPLGTAGLVLHNAPLSPHTCTHSHTLTSHPHLTPPHQHLSPHNRSSLKASRSSQTDQAVVLWGRYAPPLQGLGTIIHSFAHSGNSCHSWHRLKGLSNWQPFISCKVFVV